MALVASPEIVAVLRIKPDCLARCQGITKSGKTKCNTGGCFLSQVSYL